jgi:hypothetical protein
LTAAGSLAALATLAALTTLAAALATLAALAAAAFATLAANLRHVLSILAYCLPTLPSDLALLLLVHPGEAPLVLAAALPPLAAALTTLAALAARSLASALPPLAAALTSLAASAFATLAASLAGLFGGELVGCPFLMRRAATLAGDLALLLLVHPGEAPLVLAFVSLAHDSTLSPLGAVLQHLVLVPPDSDLLQNSFRACHVPRDLGIW